MRQKSLWFLLPAIMFLTGSTTCTKTRQHPPARVTMVNPFNQFLTQNSNAVNVTLDQNTLPLELGYSFTVSDTGTVYEIGIRMPDVGTTYTVTLWDGQNQSVLAQKPIKVINTTGFAYFDLTSTNEQVSITTGHTYVISVNLTPPGLPPGEAPPDYNFYEVERTDRSDIFPLTESYVTFQHEYTRTGYTPTFPDQLVAYPYLADGILDIGFSHTSE
jgi:hypothetical protein